GQRSDSPALPVLHLQKLVVLVNREIFLRLHSAYELGDSTSCDNVPAILGERSVRLARKPLSRQTIHNSAPFVRLLVCQLVWRLRADNRRDPAVLHNLKRSRRLSTSAFHVC